MAVNLPPGCPQKCTLPPQSCPPTLQEDCLYLNVFAPTNAKPTDRLPVMFWIYGGAYYLGYSGTAVYDGAHLAQEHGAIVVTTNYRLGALGFLRADDGSGEVIKGNFGIEDQQEALRWVKANIAGFGGDASRVTIFGESAGAYSVGVHMTDPKSADLFSAGIMESNPWAVPMRTASMQEKLARSLADQAGCPHDGEYIACLRSRSADLLLTAQEAAQITPSTFLDHPSDAFMPWVPTLGAATGYERPPIDAFRNGLAQDKPVIIGSNAQDGTLFPYLLFPFSDIPALDYSVAGSSVFGPLPWLRVSGQYPVDGRDRRNVFGDIATDGMFRCPSRAAVAAPNRTADSWIYEFYHVPSFAPQVYPAPYFNACATICCHAAELRFVFNAFDGLVQTQEEVELNKRMMSYWANFAHSHDPSASADRLHVLAELHKRDSSHPRPTANDVALADWPAYSAGGKILRLGTPMDVVESYPNASRCDFWDGKVGYNWL